MELPRRGRGDELLKPGELLSLRRRLRSIAHRHDLTTVIACAFDHRTRMLPFIYADTRMVPAGVRAVGSAMVDAGFSKTRIVLQQWNKNFRPSRMQLDGRVPDLFMVSTMGMHSDRALELIQDARRIELSQRPLIIAGGSHAVYEPFLLYGGDAKPGTGGDGAVAGPDAAVTGEEFVLLSLIEVILSFRAEGEPVRSAFFRARNAGALDEIPGLILPRGTRTETEGIADELIDTGMQRLLGDLDELPHPVLGYQLLEAPGRGELLSRTALEAARVRRYTPISSLVMTFGCKFACPYCPIPAYNQRQHRLKSPARIADEMWQLHKHYGLRYSMRTNANGEVILIVTNPLPITFPVTLNFRYIVHPSVAGATVVDALFETSADVPSSNSYKTTRTGRVNLIADTAVARPVSYSASTKLLQDTFGPLDARVYVIPPAGW